MRRFTYIFSTLLLLSISGYSQKVKYKDLYVLLNARQFEQAEPFLRKYLRDTDDNPNAFLFMGQLLQEKSAKSDVLKETELCRSLADSAVFFFERAKRSITEKELKKNDEYYEAYSRRDLRTGEFGVKLSDVQLDIDKRIELLRDRSAKVALLKSQFGQVQSLYKKTLDLFSKIQEAFPGMKELYLRADPATVTLLKHTGSRYDSCITYFNAYKSTLAQVGKTGYSQSLRPREVTDLKAKVHEEIDFYADDLRLYDFKAWSANTIDVIEKEVTPLKDELINWDIEINKLAERLKKDSVSVRSDLKPIENKIKVNPIAKFDPAPLPLEVFKMKLAELKYGSLRVENKKLRDSTDMSLKIKALTNEQLAASKLDSVSSQLLERKLEEDVKNYQHFVTNAYGTYNVLKSLIKATQDFALHETERRKAEIEAIKKSLDWLIVGQDSVPISMMSDTDRSRFRPLVIQSNSFTMGLKYEPGNDSVATGYLFTITPSRIPDLKASFTMDSLKTSKVNLPVIKGLGMSDAKGQLFFALVYSETKVQDKFPVTIAKIYKTDGLAWSNNYKLEYVPSELIFNASTGDLSVKVKSAAGDSKIVVIDKNGKLLQ